MTHPTLQACSSLDKYIGIPFLNFGRGPDYRIPDNMLITQKIKLRGLDCYGLVWHYYYYELGISIPKNDKVGGSLSPAQRRETNQAILNGLCDWEKIPLEEATCGDGLAFRRKGAPLHVSLFYAPCKMIHVVEHSHVRVENFDNFHWKPGLIGAYRYVS